MAQLNSKVFWCKSLRHFAEAKLCRYQQGQVAWQALFLKNHVFDFVSRSSRLVFLFWISVFCINLNMTSSNWQFWLLGTLIWYHVSALEWGVYAESYSHRILLKLEVKWESTYPLVHCNSHSQCWLDLLEMCWTCSHAPHSPTHVKKCTQNDETRFKTMQLSYHYAWEGPLENVI